MPIDIRRVRASPVLSWVDVSDARPATVAGRFECAPLGLGDIALVVETVLDRIPR